MANQLTNLELDQEKLDLGILNHFENDDSKEVFLKLRKMGEKKRLVIFDELDHVEDLLWTEQSRLIRALLGKNLPRWPQERWHLVRVIAESVDTFKGDNQKIIEAINLATGRNFVVFKQTVDWSKFAERAQKLLNALESLYEVQSYPQTEMAFLYLQSFCNTVQNLDQLESVYQTISLALNNLQIRKNTKFDKDEFLKELLPEFYPPQPLAPEIKQAFACFGFLPANQINWLTDPLNLDECYTAMLASWQAITVLRQNWQRLGQKPASADLLIDDLRAEVKFTGKLNDFISWQADRILADEKQQTNLS